MQFGIQQHFAKPWLQHLLQNTQCFPTGLLFTVLRGAAS